jgi:hypothetical protein
VHSEWTTSSNRALPSLGQHRLTDGNSPINGESCWTAFAVSDQLVFHATLFSFGSHLRSIRSVPDPDLETRTLQHKLNAIRLINERLSVPDSAATDHIVAGVTALTNIALVVDSFSEASKHLSGLWTLMEMRGGLSSLKSDTQRHLQRLISWNDLVYSEIFDKPLKFPPISIWEENWSAYQPGSRLESLPGLSREELRAAGVPYHEVLELLLDIRVLCEAEQVSRLIDIDDTCRMRRGDMLHRIERRLRVIIQGDMASGNSRWSATVWRAVSQAAQLFTHHYLRGNPLRYRHFGVLTMHLYDTLLIMNENVAELDFAPTLQIWLVTTAAVVTALSRDVHQHFVSLLARLCLRHGLVDYGSFEMMLREFLWTGIADERRYSSLWQEFSPGLQSVVAST